MKTSTKAAIAFIALATTVSGAAIAKSHKAGKGHKMPSFEDIDTNSSGGVSFDEFFAVASKRLLEADKDGNGSVTVAEVLEQMGDRGSERRANRMLSRFDMNEDGAVTTDELRNRMEKRFAMMDRNDDGEVQEKEFPKHGKKGKKDKKDKGERGNKAGDNN